MISARAKTDTRYLMTAQFLCSSAIFARRCKQIERDNPDNPDDATRTEHLGLVTATIMQCAAAVEAESAEITLHGPGGHLGSNGIDREAHEFLAPIAASSTVAKHSSDTIWCCTFFTNHRYPKVNNHGVICRRLLASATS
jgi:hypothetical protein